MSEKEKPYVHDDYEYLVRVISTMMNYQKDSMNKHSYKRRALTLCNLEHKQLLLGAGFGEYLDNLMNCIEANQQMLDDVLEFSEDDFEIDKKDLEGRKTFVQDYERLQRAFAQIVREWSDSGERDRSECFRPVLEDLLSLFPDHDKRKDVRVLVPGCGLGRLAFDIAKLGFQSLANEKSVLLLLTANFILNKCSRKHNYRVYPFLNDLTNRLSSADATEPVAFPDVDPTEKEDWFQLEVLSGDVIEVCREEEMRETTDCVVTTFFLDSVSNPLDIVKAAHDTLKPGGHWVNLGPLDYAYEDYTAEMSIPLPWESLKGAILSMGFEFKKEEMKDCSYLSLNNSMNNQRYHCVHFVCQKKTK